MDFIELFAGIGGFRYGLEQSGGYKCVWSNELDRYACAVYRHHWDDNTLYEGDIRTVSAFTIPEHTIICAGFPCQSFSMSGNRGGFEDTRGTLFFEICRIARAKRTKYLLLENVEGLLSHNQGTTFETIIRTLDELGYDCQWQVFDSYDYKVPQHRTRVFIIGHLRELPRPQVFPIRETTQISQQPSREYKYYNRCGKAVSPDGVSGTLLKNYGALSGESTKIIMPDGRLRIMTPLECERLQGFPDNWTELVPTKQRYFCCGNAVTTNVITAIGNKFKEAINERCS